MPKHKLRVAQIGENQFWNGQPFTFVQETFERGINKSRLPTAINFQTEVQDSNNVIVMLDKLLRARPGTSLVTSLPDTCIQGIGSYMGYSVIAASGHVYIDGVSIGACHETNDVTFVNFHGYLIILDGLKLKIYDGTVYQELIDGPTASFGLEHNDRLWVAGSTDYPYRVSVSGPNDLFDWGTSGLKLGTFFDITPYDGTGINQSKVTGLAVFYNSVLAFSESKQPIIKRISGTNLATFMAETLITNVSCVSSQTVAMTPIGLVFMARDGLYSINSSGEVTLLSEPLGRILLDTYDLSTLKSIYSSQYGLYIIGYGTTWYAYNVVTHGWFKWTFPFSITSIEQSVDGTYIGTDSGEYLKFSDSIYTDNSIPYQCSVTTGYNSFGISSISKHIYASYITVSNTEDKEVSITFLINYSDMSGYNVSIVKDEDSNTVYNNIDLGGTSSNEFSYNIQIQDLQGWDSDIFGWDSSGSVGFDGRVVNPVVYKLPLSLRCNNIAVNISFESSDIVVQKIEMIGNVLTPAP